MLMRKSYAHLGDLIKKQPEMLIKLTVKYFNSILQASFHCNWQVLFRKDFIYSVVYSIVEKIVSESFL